MLPRNFHTFFCFSAREAIVVCFIIKLENEEFDTWMKTDVVNSKSQKKMVDRITLPLFFALPNIPRVALFFQIEGFRAPLASRW